MHWWAPPPRACHIQDHSQAPGRTCQGDQQTGKWGIKGLPTSKGNQRDQQTGGSENEPNNSGTWIGQLHCSPLRRLYKLPTSSFPSKVQNYRGYIQCTTEGIRKSYTIWCKQKLKLSLWDEICPTFYDPISCHNLFTEMWNSVAKMCSQDAQLKQKTFQKPQRIEWI